MERFNLTIFNQKRVLIGLLISPISLFAFILIGAKIGSFIIGIILFFLSLYIVYYYCVGYLTIVINNDDLSFDWKKKKLFNFKNIEPIKISEITAIIIDNGEFIRKIETNKRTIKINSGKIKSEEALKLIQKLSTQISIENFNTIDSWDEWNKKGYLKIAYTINIVLMILATLLVTFFILTKGFHSKYLFVFLILIPQLYIYGQQMKSKLKK